MASFYTNLLKNEKKKKGRKNIILPTIIRKYVTIGDCIKQFVCILVNIVVEIVICLRI